MLRRGLLVLTFVVLAFWRIEIGSAQEQFHAGDTPLTKAQQDEDHGVATAVIFGGLLGLGVAAAALAITRGAWAMKRRDGKRPRDADEVVKRLG